MKEKRGLLSHLYEHLKTKKKYNTLQLKYEVLQDELDRKTVELNTERRIKEKLKTTWETTLKEQEQEIIELKKRKARKKGSDNIIMDNVKIDIRNESKQIQRIFEGMDYVSINDLLATIEELDSEKEHIEEEYEDFKKDVEENYKLKEYDPYDEFGVSRNDFC